MTVLRCEIETVLYAALHSFPSLEKMSSTDVICSALKKCFSHTNGTVERMAMSVDPEVLHFGPD